MGLRDTLSVCYAIKNTETNKLYVGITNNIETRIYSHLVDLRNGRHCNRALQLDYNTFGETFEFYELEDEIDFENRNNKEFEWILELETYNPMKGYNTKDKRIEKYFNGPKFTIIKGVPDTN